MPRGRPKGSKNKPQPSPKPGDGLPPPAISVEANSSFKEDNNWGFYTYFAVSFLLLAGIIVSTFLYYILYIQ